VKRLKALCAHTATLENRDGIGPMTEKAKQLEEQNMKLEIEKEVFIFHLHNFHANVDKTYHCICQQIHICKL
jgi:hypothetical protein